MTKHLRCAVYTRVSTEVGLDQEFTSLDNQREAAEAYIKSQAGEGWRLLPVRFDDGGFSGGSMERPGMQQLITAVALKQVDVVVVYKVDRLTRSLADFAKLVELFDGHGVSFVSVTQAFNTTTSMGRLTLNVLLSFAQFEREVTGERIRDKIAASKAKGIWMGGFVPLGYRVQDRALHVVPEHAAVVREVFARYLALNSVAKLAAELDGRGIPVPSRTDRGGKTVGGVAWSVGYLSHILKSPLYIGRLSHKGRVHEGQHPAIIDLATWEEVQVRMTANRRNGDARPVRAGALLVGRIQDRDGIVLTPTYAQRNGTRTDLYVSRAVLKRQPCPSGIRRIPAVGIEAAVVEALRAAVPAASEQDEARLVTSHLATVVVHPDRLELRLADEEGRIITLPWSMPLGRRSKAAAQNAATRKIEPDDRARILRAIATARTWTEELVSTSVESRPPSRPASSARSTLSGPRSRWLTSRRQSCAPSSTAGSGPASASGTSRVCPPAGPSRNARSGCSHLQHRTLKRCGGCPAPAASLRAGPRRRAQCLHRSTARIVSDPPSIATASSETRCGRLETGARSGPKGRGKRSHRDGHGQRGPANVRALRSYSARGLNAVGINCYLVERCRIERLTHRYIFVHPTTIRHRFRSVPTIPRLTMSVSDVEPKYSSATSHIALDCSGNRSMCSAGRKTRVFMTDAGLSITDCLDAISTRLADAAAIARAAVVCAESGSEREALRIAMDLDVLLSEAGTLHGAVCLLGRMSRDTAAGKPPT